MIRLRWLVLLSITPLALACPGEGSTTGEPTTTRASDTTSVVSTATGDPPTSTGTTETTGDDTGASVCPEADVMLDVLFVVDNSAGMVQEQANLAASMPHLLTRLRGLTAPGGAPMELDVNLMFTTTDVGHPLCAEGQDPGYWPADGAPTSTPCSERLSHFADLGGVSGGSKICSDACPQAAAPTDPFVHFAGAGHNVIDAGPEGDPVAQALACLSPQGFVGCGYEAPLAVLLRALDPGKPWNAGERPFLRDCAALAIVVISDETDCSIADDGYRYFDPDSVDDPAYNLYMEDAPGMPGVKKYVTSAVCWNGAMACEDADSDGVYESCVPEDRGVLQPLARYTDFVQGLLAQRSRERPVFMLAITGVPPTEGGLADLVYHDFTDSDLLPGDMVTAADWQHSFGIGPGCSHPTIGHALPPGRIAAVCQALNMPDDPATPGDDALRRCCVESICRDEYSGAFDCLADQLAQQLGPASAGPTGPAGPAALEISGPRRSPR